MATSKKEFSATDASPVVLYGLKSPSNPNAIPIVVTSNGALLISGGLDMPPYDFISFSPPNLPTTILFKIGGSGGTNVRTLTLTYSGFDIATMTVT